MGVGSWQPLQSMLTTPGRHANDAYCSKHSACAGLWSTHLEGRARFGGAGGGAGGSAVSEDHADADDEQERDRAAEAGGKRHEQRSVTYDARPLRSRATTRGPVRARVWPTLGGAFRAFVAQPYSPRCEHQREYPIEAMAAAVSTQRVGLPGRPRRRNGQHEARLVRGSQPTGYARVLKEAREYPRVPSSDWSNMRRPFC